jgi:hypothetical protein
VQLSPEDAQALINDEAEVEAAIEDELREAAIEDELREAAIDDEPPEVTPLVQATSLVQLGDSLPPALDHLGSSPAISATSVAEAALDDDGGRGRRSRRSVNYKEPNLTRCVSVLRAVERAGSRRACWDWSSVLGVVKRR